MEKNAVEEILKFWQEAGPSKWWRKDPGFDDEIRLRFGKLHTMATKGDLDQWREEPGSCLALVILLDQFSRNLFRGDARTFAQDEYGLEVAKYAVAKGFDISGNDKIYGFFHLPYMHSEELADQNTCVELIQSRGDKNALKSAIEHRGIIEKFGRFPHRNPVLGRDTTRDEQKFLDEGGFAG